MFEDSDARLLVCIGFVDWYLETHPRFVCQSGDYLREEEVSIAVLLKEFVEPVERLS